MENEKKLEQAVTNTEEQIKEAAKRVFTRKGYAATRTRDIAEESGHNLALLNYYFRSKEKLFDIIMLENLELFLKGIIGIINDESTSLQYKIETLVSHYIDMLIENPNLPVFMLNAINNDPNEIIEKMAAVSDITQTYIAKQWIELSIAKQLNVNPVHFFLNLLSLIIFPFAANKMVKLKTGLTDDAFNQIMQERKKMIPFWIQAMMAKPSYH